MSQDEKKHVTSHTKFACTKPGAWPAVCETNSPTRHSCRKAAAGLAIALELRRKGVRVVSLVLTDTTQVSYSQLTKG